MRRVMLILLLFITAGAIAGWLSSGGKTASTRQQDAGWSSPALPGLGDQARQRLYDQLMASSHFGSSNDQSIAGTGLDQDGNQPDTLPKIAATTLRDGVVAVSLYGQDGKIFTANVGDQLPGGWTIEEATLEHIVVKKDGDNRELTVFPHGDVDS